MTLKTAARLALLLGGFLAAGSAAAQATRTWVSGVGDDVNPCSRTAPCRTFAGAIPKTAAGGIIDVLDPGSYGTLTITKALTVDGHGHVAGVTSAGTTGFVINAGAGDVVTLRNLTINGTASLGTNGIRFVAGSALHVENVVIQQQSVGLSFEPSGASELHVLGGTISDTNTGVQIKPGAGGTAAASFDRVSIVGNGSGMRVEAGGIVSVRDSVVSANTNSGINAVSTTGVAQVTVRNTLLARNNEAALAANAALKANGSSATINVDGNSVVYNGQPFAASGGGTIESTGNNFVRGNTLDSNPTVTVPAF